MIFTGAYGYSNGVGVYAYSQWTAPQRIPGYEDNTEPPYLIADQNRTVHAFAYQQLGEGEREVGIIYSQWTWQQGWTTPNDIMLSPLKHQARIQGVFLDQRGMIHLIFFGGDETEANIYYTNAPALEASKAYAWSQPIPIGENALVPSTAALSGDNLGNLVILYSGNIDGQGVYAIRSSDWGISWSEPINIFQTNDDEHWPWELQLYMGQSGWLHAIWNVVAQNGQGRGIYYSQLNMNDTEWSTVLSLAKVEAGLGTWNPAIIEYDSTLMVVYNLGSKINVQRSDDKGQTWTEPIQPFLQHVGVNGLPALVVDSNKKLHIFWGQRIPGDQDRPDTHGMWHSVWQNNNWSPPEAVVSGPRIVDTVGYTGFDPVAAHAVMSQGNVLLVTWRTDPGDIKPNGVWYSSAQLDTPELPVVMLPTITPSPIPLVTPLVVAVVQPTNTQTPIIRGTVLEKEHPTQLTPGLMLLVGLLPVLFWVISVVITKTVFTRH